MVFTGHPKAWKMVVIWISLGPGLPSFCSRLLGGCLEAMKLVGLGKHSNILSTIYLLYFLSPQVVGGRHLLWVDFFHLFAPVGFERERERVRHAGKGDLLLKDLGRRSWVQADSLSPPPPPNWQLRSSSAPVMIVYFSLP